MINIKKIIAIKNREKIELYRKTSHIFSISFKQNKRKIHISTNIHIQLIQLYFIYIIALNGIFKLKIFVKLF